MYPGTEYRSLPISPSELDMICQVFDELLEEYHLPREGPEADDLAARLFSIYQSGVRDMELLKKLTAPFKQ